MENIIRFVINHRVLVATSVILVIFISWIISFFLSNSLLMVTVDSSASNYIDEVIIKLDDRTVNKTEIGSTSLIVVPRSSLYISAQSTNNSVLANLTIPAIIGNVDLKLLPSSQVSIADTSGNNCYYKKSNTITSWECNSLEFGIRKTTYTDDSFPLQSSVELDNQYLEYAQKYKDGFLAISNLDGLGIHYVDLSADKPSVTKLESSIDYKYETTQVVVDSKDSNKFIVADQDTLSYKLYDNSLTTPIKSGKLPSDFKSRTQASTSINLEGGILTYYTGYSSDDKDDHSSDSKDSYKGYVTSYDLNSSSLSSKLSTDDLSCSNVAVNDESLACIDRSVVRIYNRDDLSDPKITLSNSNSVFLYNDSIYISQDSSIYKYKDDDNTLNSIFKVADRNIASSYINDGVLYTSAWYTYPDNRQRTIAYEVDLNKSQKTPPIVNTFPFNISSDLAYGTDVYQNNIYVVLVNDTSDSRSKIRSIIQKAGLGDDYKLVFN